MMHITINGHHIDMQRDNRWAIGRINGPYTMMWNVWIDGIFVGAFHRPVSAMRMIIRRVTR